MHDVSVFASGSVSLDDWLRRRALKSEGRTARTYVVCEGQRVVGYYTLATGSVTRSDVPRILRPHGTPDPVPVIVIGRLAVDRQYHRRGIGGGLLRDGLLRSLDLARSVGCAAVVVHAIDENAAAFYKAFDFIEFPGGSRTLFLPLRTLAAAI